MYKRLYIYNIYRGPSKETARKLRTLVKAYYIRARILHRTDRTIMSHNTIVYIFCL